MTTHWNHHTNQTYPLRRVVKEEKHPDNPVGLVLETLECGHTNTRSVSPWGKPAKRRRCLKCGSHRICIGFGEFEGECSNVAGTPWTDIWCQRCDELRRESLSRQMAALKEKFGIN